MPLPTQSQFNVRVYAETPLIAKILRDAIAKDEPGFESKSMDTFTRADATAIPKFKGLTYIDIPCITPHQMARIAQGYSGIVGMTTVTKTGNGVLETDVSDAMKQARLVVGTAHPARYPEARS